VIRLETGAELRLQGPAGGDAVICLNGGQRAHVEGTWSASLEWLVGRLVPRFPALRFGEVRYRIKSWERLHECVADARAAVRAVGAQRTLLIGFSMGGAVSASVAEEPSVETVLGLAPWLPDRLSLEPLRGKRLRVLHGSLDRALPGIPGVSPALARRGFDRALQLGAEGSFTIIPGGVHGLALRAPWGAAVALPRAGRWAALAADELRRFSG
jgi:pimeloyl-ACP methyl ester carboxylesterase